MDVQLPNMDVQLANMDVVTLKQGYTFPFISMCALRGFILHTTLLFVVLHSLIFNRNATLKE